MADTILYKDVLESQSLKLRNAVENHLKFIEKLFSLTTKLYFEITDMEAILHLNPQDFLNPDLKEIQIKRIHKLVAEFDKITNTQQEVV